MNEMLTEKRKTEKRELELKEEKDQLEKKRKSVDLFFSGGIMVSFLDFTN